MKRKAFLKQAALATAGTLVAPYILPSGRLFAATGSRAVNHVVFVMFAGGVRNYESVHFEQGNLMQGLLRGGGAVPSWLLPSLTPLKTPPHDVLQREGTLYKEFRFDDKKKLSPTGHFNGHVTAVTGRYTDNTLSLRDRPAYPTVFEMYRKHSDPAKAAINSWWISHTNNLYPVLNYSSDPNYGAAYGANQISPTALFTNQNRLAIGNMLNLDKFKTNKLAEMRAFLDNNFGKGAINLNSGVVNTTENAKKIQDFINQMYLELAQGQHNDPWGMGANRMNGDMFNVFYAEKVLEAFKPELLVVNMFGVDVAHSNYSAYCDNLRKIDFAVNHLWHTIQNTPGMKDDTVMIIAPEIGRNKVPNSIRDSNGMGGLDHTTDDPVSREIFCMVLGPKSVVVRDRVIQTKEGESVDIVPTIAKLLGFYTPVSGILEGQPLNSALLV